MNFSPLTFASPVVIIHLILALAAFVVGGIQLATKKGSRTHKTLGYVWVVAVVAICLTSFGIKEVMPNGVFGGYSPIHLLSLFILFQVFRGIYFARNNNIKMYAGDLHRRLGYCWCLYICARPFVIQYVCGALAVK